MESNVSEVSDCQQTIKELLSSINESETNIRDQIELINNNLTSETNGIAVLATILSRVGNNIDTFRNGNRREILAAICDTLAGVTEFIPGGGSLFSAVLKLLSLLLGRKNLGTLVDSVINEALQNFKDNELSSMAYATKRTFCVAFAYLGEMDGGSDMNQWEISPMIQMTIFKGIEFLGVLGLKLKSYTLNKGEHEKAMAFIRLYCELSVLRYSVLYQMHFIARSTGHCNYIARSIMNVIKEAKEEDVRLLQFLSEPSIENILFFSYVNLFDDKWNTVERFMDFIGLPFQNLHRLTKGEYRISPVAWPHKNLIINKLQIVESSTCLRESGSITFTATEEENVFYITSRQYPECRFHMIADTCGFVKGTRDDKDGAERWKVIRLKDGTYTFSTKKWPSWFMYMVDTDIGWALGSKGLPPGRQGNWHIELLPETPVFERNPVDLVPRIDIVLDKYTTLVAEWQRLWKVVGSKLAWCDQD